MTTTSDRKPHSSTKLEEMWESSTRVTKKENIEDRACQDWRRHTGRWNSFTSLTSMIMFVLSHSMESNGVINIAGNINELSALDCDQPIKVQALQTGNCTQPDLTADIQKSPIETWHVVQEVEYFTYTAIKCNLKSLKMDRQ